MSLRDQFLIDPDVVFLNHGSFGATPIPVFERYQYWQRELERQPVNFVVERMAPELKRARDAVGEYVNVNGDDVVFVRNVTYGVNVVAHSLNLGAGDEVLTTDHEYGACNNTWDYVSKQKGFKYVKQPIALPVTTPDDVIEQLWQGVNENTKLLFLSHITSATALCFPIKEIVAKAKAQGIMTMIDGAHTPGHIALDLTEIDADFYAGNLHKWLCAPKGTAFLHTRPDRQSLIEPLVIGWGWGPEKSLNYGSDYLDKLQFTGTDDLASYFSVPDAIQFQAEYHWNDVRQKCSEMVQAAMHQICDITGEAPIYADGQGFYHQMATMRLPAGTDTMDLKKRLYEDYRVEIPIMTWQQQPFIRISLQGYNTWDDVEILKQGVQALL